MFLYKLWELCNHFLKCYAIGGSSHSIKTGADKTCRACIWRGWRSAKNLKMGECFFFLNPFTHLLFLLMAKYFISFFPSPPDPGLLSDAVSVYNQLPLTWHKNKNIGFVGSLSSFCNKDPVTSRFPEGKSWSDKEQSYLNNLIFSVKTMFFFSFFTPQVIWYRFFIYFSTVWVSQAWHSIKSICALSIITSAKLPQRLLW